MLDCVVEWSYCLDPAQDKNSIVFFLNLKHHKRLVFKIILGPPFNLCSKKVPNKKLLLGGTPNAAVLPKTAQSSYTSTVVGPVFYLPWKLLASNVSWLKSHYLHKSSLDDPISFIKGVGFYLDNKPIFVSHFN